jgi:glycerol uptake facilitator-like aquaporin
MNTRALAAEFLGSMLLLMAVVGSGIMAETLAGGNTAVALLANAMATAAMLFGLIAVFGPVSGAHFNPCVSAAMALRGAIPWRAAIGYLAPQIAGAILGVIAAHAMFALPLVSAETQLRTGFGQWLAEAAAVFGLLTLIFHGARHAPGSLAAIVSLYILAAYWFTASTSFANPAVTIARAFTGTFAGIRLEDVPGFIAAQFAGMFAALAVDRLFRDERS